MNFEWSDIEKILNGNATEEEVVRFNQWLTQNPSQRAYFEQVKKYYYDRENSVAANKLVRKSHHIADNILLKSRSGKLRVLRIASVAAAIAVVIMTSLFVYKHTPAPVPQEQPAIAHTNQSIKILKDDGTEIALNEAGINIETDSHRIEYTKTHKTVEYHTISIPFQTDYELVLADGTSVKLNAGSRLRYPTQFLDGEPRRVYLDGEAYFEVAKSKTNRFIVNVNAMNVIVYGTKFNVNSFDETIETILVEGAVGVEAGGKEAKLRPNQRARVSKSDDKIVVDNVNALSLIDWTSDYFNFKDERLEVIIDKLKRWYGCDIVFENESAKDERFSCHIDKSVDLDNFLRAVVNTDKVTFRKKGPTYVIH